MEKLKATGRGQVRLNREGLTYRSLSYELSHEYHVEHAVDGSPDHEKNEEFLTSL